nr:hypothetical protein CR513_46747 [Ipomoea batatas]
MKADKTQKAKEERDMSTSAVKLPKAKKQLSGQRPQQVLQIEAVPSSPLKNTSLFLSPSVDPPVKSSFDDDVLASPAVAAALAVVNNFCVLGSGPLLFLSRQKKRMSSRRKSAKTQPTTITTMAPVESFLEFLCCGVICVAGINPLRRLSETLKSVKLGRLMLGNVPSNPFFCK